MHGGHDHHHAHDHAPQNFGRTFAIAIGLNVALVIAQVIYGLLTNSLALLADAGHNAGDVMGLVMAWAAYAVADWRPSERFTYRMRAASISVGLRQRADPAGGDRRHHLGSDPPPHAAGAGRLRDGDDRGRRRGGH